MFTASRMTHYVLRGMLVLFLSCWLGLIVGLIILHMHGARLLSVETASMVPTFRPGDALVVVPTSPKAVRTGEVISYLSPRDPRVIISHRLVGSDTITGQLITAGDRQGTHDPPFSSAALVGKVIAVAPHLGTVLDALRQPVVIIMALVLPATILLYNEWLCLVHFFLRPLYRAHGYQRPSSDRLKL